MSQYVYHALNQAEEPVTGRVDAESVSAAIEIVEGRGLTIQSIALSSMPAQVSQGETARQSRSRTLDQQFDAVMQRRDILVPALEALVDEMPASRASGELRDLVKVLKSARSSSELSRHAVVVQWLPLLATGFSAQSSTRRLSDLVAGASRESQNRNQRRRLLAYPLAVILLAILVCGFLCVVVVPTFSNMFDEFGLRLPAATRMVVFVAEQLSQHPIRFFSGLGTLAVATYGLIRLWLRFSMTTQLFGSSVAGNTASVSAMSSLCSQLAELQNINVALPDALWIAGQGCQHYYFKQVTERLARFTHDENRPLSQAPDARCLPANLILALQSGPGGSANIPLLRQLSALYGERAAARVDWASGASAQLAIIVVGLMVGFLVVALFSPLFQLITGLS